MNATLTRPVEAALPSEEEREVALEASRLLSAHVQPAKGLRLQLPGSRKKETVVLPPMAARLLLDLLAEMARGNAVTLIPIHAELTTQQAADILNVSRPFLVKLIDEKKVPAHTVGTHRRVLFADLMRYKQLVDRDRMKVLDELARQAQESGLGY